MPSVTRWEVSVLAPGDSAWRRTWAKASRLPRAVTLSFWKDSVLLGPPLVVRLSDAFPAGWVEDEPAAE